MHSGIRPFSCTICRMSFSKTSELKRHVARHVGPLNAVGDCFQIICLPTSKTYLNDNVESRPTSKIYLNQRKILSMKDVENNFESIFAKQSTTTPETTSTTTLSKASTTATPPTTTPPPPTTTTTKTPTTATTPPPTATATTTTTPTVTRQTMESNTVAYNVTKNEKNNFNYESDLTVKSLHLERPKLSHHQEQDGKMLLNYNTNNNNDIYINNNNNNKFSRISTSGNSIEDNSSNKLKRKTFMQTNPRRKKLKKFREMIVIVSKEDLDSWKRCNECGVFLQTKLSLLLHKASTHCDFATKSVKAETHNDLLDESSIPSDIPLNATKPIKASTHCGFETKSVKASTHCGFESKSGKAETRCDFDTKSVKAETHNDLLDGSSIQNGITLKTSTQNDFSTKLDKPSIHSDIPLTKSISIKASTHCDSETKLDKALDHNDLTLTRYKLVEASTHNDFTNEDKFDKNVLLSTQIDSETPKKRKSIEDVNEDTKRQKMNNLEETKLCSVDSQSTKSDQNIEAELKLNQMVYSDNTKSVKNILVKSQNTKSDQSIETSTCQTVSEHNSELPEFHRQDTMPELNTDDETGSVEMTESAERLPNIGPEDSREAVDHFSNKNESQNLDEHTSNKNECKILDEHLSNKSESQDLDEHTSNKNESQNLVKYLSNKNGSQNLDEHTSNKNECQILDEHLSNKNGSKNSAKNFSNNFCEICGSVFRDEVELIEHIYKSHVNKG